ncbi:MAG: preprotein translocase subunit SecA [Proteobacteria bacterium]|nr:preprotein translocase subunit SecA [Pseudomonadota bacterium]
MFGPVLKKVLGTKHEREVKRMRPVVEAINAQEPAIKKLSDADLRAKTAEFRARLERGATLDDLLIDAFAVCREAGVRALGMRHYDVQLVGGMVLHHGKIAEMKTGEGKTLVATLACYLNALEGKGVHVVTVNDYLARRDAEWMGKLHGFLGLRTGVILNAQYDSDKKRAYEADITYGQNNEFGFDYLRDNMKFSIYDYVQRDLNYAIVDEVDSILIDEARTPLIISGRGRTASDKYVKINEIVPRLRKDEHFTVDEKNHSVTLTEEGIEVAQKELQKRSLTEAENLYDPVNLETLHILQQLLRAHALYKRDQQYMVSEDGKVLIIDEFTGRVLAGRRWSDGLHQAVEAKENVPIQEENATLATISFQNLFRLYRKLAGMTGTADTEATEFHKTYKLDVTVIPTNKPMIRADHDDLVYKTEREKFKAVVEEISDCQSRGQPVLVGTTSVEKSDALSRMLTRREIAHQVLNAKQHEREAYVVAQAGRKGAVTVATNMAGRGTDIVLGGNPEMLGRMEAMQSATEELLADREAFDAAVRGATERYVEDCEKQKAEILEAGGLHIVGTERHESRRIDNQLRGRSGRQGDPGSSRFYLSLEDDLMRIFAGDRMQGFMDRLGMEEDVPIEHRWVTKAVENAQTKVEERNFDIRKHLLEYDDVMNQQRKSVYSLRRQVLMGQYRSVPSEDERKKGIEPRPLVKGADAKVSSEVQPILSDMVKAYAASPPPDAATPEQREAWQREVMQRSIESFSKLEARALEQQVYVTFGCQSDLESYASNPKGALEFLGKQVPLSMTEQRERLLDLNDELIGTMVEHACPPKAHFEDWDISGLQRAYEDQFGIPATGLEKHADPGDLAAKLYEDVEAVLKKKEAEVGQLLYLRLFRNFYLQEIDNRWLEHLQDMDHLRDGIGLRGYGQRDPKKEYQKEGYDLFLQMVQSVKASVAHNMSHFVVEREDEIERDVERLEEQRRRKAEAQQQRIRMSHASQREGSDAGAARGKRARGAGRGPAAGKPATVRRDQPKLGRNEPCWCGSGKKYKQCHLRSDQDGPAVGAGG